MKKHFAVLAALLALSTHTLAQQQPAPASGFRVLFGMGLTGGGDKVGDTVAYSNGSSTALHAGGLVDLRGGFEYQLQGQAVSLELSLGYHFDRAAAKNGDVTFSRMPMDLVAHFDVAPNWRVGLGARKSLSAKVSTSGAGNGYATEQKYTTTPGPLIEGEYFFDRNLSFRLRFVSESFKPENGGSKLDGSHVGFYGMFNF